MNPFISICIPAYKNKEYLEILLKSIVAQDFKDYEVVVTDDSPDDSVEEACNSYRNILPLVYQRNQPAKGSPANWNAAIALAKGQWIKLMHDDDWFAGNKSLQHFAEAAQADSTAGFIFSGYARYENGVLKSDHPVQAYSRKKLADSPLSLFASNFIGHPSVTMVKNNRVDWYDERTKWVVDFEFYIRCLHTEKFHIITEPLINIGINDEQITKAVFRDPDVEIPENLYLLEKMGTGILENIKVYDHYWRMFRNLGIRNFAAIENHSRGYTLPLELKKMLRFQFKIPLGILKIGPFSKALMAISRMK
ncbi:glycosyltransferase family 2 protein [Ferruginibacter sp. HRS2-29]|uniref:glycosyltransferase family 2 protein n=1 Tax=Ferruginibacter sp. HRS2-29 TaxID=2487334 RepID=UPI0020CBC656|nr:glycosyltransferase family 2 protein [Ferruginibacter sp. HRS2-29]MCP9750919.1 glycosyltransferase family 2 protein [Ferruginibacter sp. HRS2-29]